MRVRMACMAKKSSKKSTKADPWEKPAPKSRRHTKLSPRSKARAKAAAKKAGRKYPSLVDNMNAAKKQKSAKARHKKRAAKSR